MEPKDDEGPKDATYGSGKSQNEGEQMKKPEVEAQNLDPPETQNPETETKTPEHPKK
jgi:hypothetical protein